MRVLLSIASVVLFAAAAGAQRADTIVKKVGAPKYAGVGALVEEMSIGKADGDDHYVLGDPNDLAVTKDGSIILLDQSIPELRLYTAAGKWVKTFSRRGSGPGEFTASSGILALDDGRILHWDTGNWRINVFSATGEPITQWTTPSGTSGTSMSSATDAMLVDRQGTLYLTRSIIKWEPTFSSERVWIRRRLDGTLIDTMRAPKPVSSGRELRAQNGGSTQTSNVPYDPHYVVALSPMGNLVTGYANRYAFEIHQPNGQLLSVRRDAQPEPVSRLERDTARARTIARMQRTDAAWSWNGPDIPATKPFYESLSVAQDGRIWVNTTTPLPPPPSQAPMGGGGRSGGRSGRPPGSECPSTIESLYDLFEPDGSYIGRIRVPPRVSIRTRRGDLVWAITCDSDDIPMVKRYRIAWSGR